MIFLTSVYFQIFLSMILGVVLGIERSFAGKTAGMRTYGLVSMGSCLFIIISNSIVTFYQGTPFVVQPLQLAVGIITGIGFLCGGVIIFRDDHVFGLTTAAGMWVACGIGLAVGFGLYALAIFTTAITLFNFTILWALEQKIIHRAGTRRDN